MNIVLHAPVWAGPADNLRTALGSVPYQESPMSRPGVTGYPCIIAVDDDGMIRREWRQDMTVDHADLVEWKAKPGTPEPVQAPVPQVVSRFQARAAMMLAPATSGDFDNLLQQIEAAVAASDSALARLAWAEAVEWRRDSVTVNALASAVGVTGDQLDELFRQAAGIVA